MKNMNTVEITKIGLVAAVLCIIAPLSIPIGPVPISLRILLFMWQYLLLAAGEDSFLILSIF